MAANVINFTAEALSDDKLKDMGLVLVDFWATWCGPCRMMAPTVEEISDELSGKLTVGKLNIDDYTDYAIAKGVVSIPTLMLFKDGVEVGRLIGVQPKEAVLDLIAKA